MVERIRITSDRIITRKADNSISFDTNNLCLKTEAAGNLKAGGYQRCPSISGGSNVSYDWPWYGGFPLYLIPANSKFTPFSFICPSSLARITAVQTQLPGIFVYEYFSSAANITSNGNVVGTFRISYVRETEFLLPGMGGSDYYQDTAWTLKDIKLNSTFGGGTVTFNNPSNNNLYTYTGTMTQDPNDPMYFIYDPAYFTYDATATANVATYKNHTSGPYMLPLVCTLPAINLSLAVSA